MIGNLHSILYILYSSALQQVIDYKVVQVYDDQGHIVTNYHVIESLEPAGRHMKNGQRHTIAITRMQYDQSCAI